MNNRTKTRRSMLGPTMWFALLAIPGTAPVAAQEPTEAEIAAYKKSFEGYCQSVEDVLDTGAHAVVHDDPTREGAVAPHQRFPRKRGLYFRS